MMLLHMYMKCSSGFGFSNPFLSSNNSKAESGNSSKFRDGGSQNSMMNGWKASEKESRITNMPRILSRELYGWPNDLVGKNSRKYQEKRNDMNRERKHDA